MGPKKGKKGCIRFAAALAGLVLLAGCSVLQNILGPSEQFTATLAAEGAVVIPAASLGRVSIPQAGVGLLNLVVTLAGPYLAKEAKLTSCKFTSYPPQAGPPIVVTGTAVCDLSGQSVNETVTLTLAPLAS